MTGSTLIAEATLPEALQRGLRAILASAEPDARVVAVRDNFAVIALGDMEAPAIYVEQTVALYVRVPLTFPHATPYGIVTDPYLTRRDRVAIDRTTRTIRTPSPSPSFSGDRTSASGVGTGAACHFVGQKISPRSSSGRVSAFGRDRHADLLTSSGQ